MRNGENEYFSNESAGCCTLERDLSLVDRFITKVRTEVLESNYVNDVFIGKHLFFEFFKLVRVFFAFGILIIFVCDN